MLVATPRVFLSWNTHPASLASPSRRRVGCDSWRLHWGLVLESLANRSVCIPYHDFSFVSFPLFSYVLVYNSFMLLVCFFKCMHEIDVYSFDAHKHLHFFAHTVSLLRALYPGPWEHRKRRRICGHAKSLTCLMTVKPHLEFFSLMICCRW